MQAGNEYVTKGNTGRIRYLINKRVFHFPLSFEPSEKCLRCIGYLLVKGSGFVDPVNVMMNSVDTITVFEPSRTKNTRDSHY